MVMSADLHLRRLTVGDLPQVRKLLDADPGYARRVTGADPRPGDAAELLAGGPPGLRPEQKMLLGAFDDTGLAAVIDVLRGWPVPATAHVGLLQVHADRKREGLGRRAHDLLLNRVARWPQITTLRAAIVATNVEHAEPFWSALGYRPAEAPRPYRAGNQPTHVTAWTRPVNRAAYPAVRTNPSTGSGHERSAL
jgi:GNAT superfamily N-acetyltransferase